MRPIGMVLAAASLSSLLFSPAMSEPKPEDADRLFAEARTMCQRDNGRLWGVSLCGPMLLVDYHDRSVLANQPDPQHVLQPAGNWFRGTLPDDVIIADTPTEWSGARWTQIDAPLPDDAARFHVLVAHELFHRIQPKLGLTRPEAPNHHLDTFNGRYLLLLEWRALTQALQAATADGRRAALADALAFRRERYRIFPQAAADEAALEIAEGVPEYTGVMLGLTKERERTAYAIRDLSAFVDAPTFVRSFAYATGPAYGLLLDRASPGWKTRLNAGQSLYTLLAATLPNDSVDATGTDERARRYDDGTLRARETAREHDRQARLADLRARLVDGPVLVLPLAQSNFQFNPQTLVALDGVGTVYPSMRLTDVWGSLEVERGGALVRSTTRLATVPRVGPSADSGNGDGWRLQLKPGWAIVPGQRTGDLTVTHVDSAPTSR